MCVLSDCYYHLKLLKYVYGSSLLFLYFALPCHKDNKRYTAIPPHSLFFLLDGEITNGFSFTSSGGARGHHGDFDRGLQLNPSAAVPGS